MDFREKIPLFSKEGEGRLLNNKINNLRGFYMTRRDFLRLFLLGGFFSLIGRKVKAEEKAGKKPEKMLKEAMFWRRLH